MNGSQEKTGVGLLLDLFTISEKPLLIATDMRERQAGVTFDTRLARH